MISSRHLVSLLLGLCLCVISIRIAVADENSADSAVEPTTYGDVFGHVYDADTGQPIIAAVITVQEDGVFAPEGRTVGTSDAAGHYNCEVKIGRESSNLDVGRLLSTGVAGLLMGGATKKQNVLTLAG